MKLYDILMIDCSDDVEYLFIDKNINYTTCNNYTFGRYYFQGFYIVRYSKEGFRNE